MENNVFKKLPITMGNATKGFLKYNISKNKSCRNPFFSVKNQKETVSSFIDAINSDKTDLAMSFVSRYVSNIDVDELKEIFNHKIVCKCIAVKPLGGIKGYISLALEDTKDNGAEIVHIKVVHEPNGNSRWKIFEIIRE